MELLELKFAVELLVWLVEVGVAEEAVGVEPVALLEVLGTFAVGFALAVR